MDLLDYKNQAILVETEWKKASLFWIFGYWKIINIIAIFVVHIASYNRNKGLWCLLKIWAKKYKFKLIYN